MRQLWLLPDVLHFPLSCCVRLTLLPMFAWMGSLLWRGRLLGPYLRVRGGIPPRTPSKTNQAQQGWARGHLGPYSPLGHGWASCGFLGPLLVLGISPLQNECFFLFFLFFFNREVISCRFFFFLSINLSFYPFLYFLITK